MKVDIDELAKILEKNQVKKEVVVKVINELSIAAEENKAEKSTEPKAKNEFLVLVYDDGTLAGKELTASVVQIPSGEDAGLTLGKISEAAKEFNTNTRKGRKNPVKTIADALATVSRKFLKKQRVNAKTKEVVRVIITNNQIV